MTKAAFPSLKDGGVTQDCWVHDAMGLSDEAFKDLTGASKDQIGKCSDQQQNLKQSKDDDSGERRDISSPGYIQSLQDRASSGSGDYNEMPQYEHVVRLTGNGAITTCSNHYGITMGSQVSLEKNLGRLRPQLNPGESHESQHRINHRNGLIADRARKAWNAIINTRFKQKNTPFSLEQQEGEDKERITPQERLNRMMSAGWGEDPKDEKIDDASAMNFDKNYAYPDLNEGDEVETIELNPNIHSGENE